MIKPILVVLTDQPETFQLWLDESVAKAMNSITLNSSAGAPALTTEQLLTIEDVCREFGISKTTLSEWMKNDIVPFLRLGRRVYFERAQVVAAGRKHTKYQRGK